MSPSELAINRKNTKIFIDANPILIDLRMRDRQRDANGPLWVDSGIRSVQTFRLIDQSSNSQPVPGTIRSSTSDGIQRTVQFVLLGEHDSDIGLYDYWLDPSGIRWEVIELLPDNGYERKALVSRFGEV